MLCFWWEIVSWEAPGMFLVHPGWLPGLLGNFHIFDIFGIFRISGQHETSDCRPKTGTGSCQGCWFNFLLLHRGLLTSHFELKSMKSSQNLQKNDLLLQVAFWPLVAPRRVNPEESASHHVKSIQKHRNEPQGPHSGKSSGFRKAQKSKNLVPK